MIRKELIIKEPRSRFLFPKIYRKLIKPELVKPAKSSQDSYFPPSPRPSVHPKTQRSSTIGLSTHAIILTDLPDKLPYKPYLIDKSVGPSLPLFIDTIRKSPTPKVLEMNLCYSSAIIHSSKLRSVRLKLLKTQSKPQPSK